MAYKFDINSLDILNNLIFDSRMNPAELQLSNEGTVELNIDRRGLEEVERKKTLFWNTTIWKGKKSRLKLFGLKNMNVLLSDEKLKDEDHFIDGVIYDPIMGILEIVTSFGLSAEFEIKDEFYCILTDLGPSDFGGGSCHGKVSFTKEEWKEYLKEMDYNIEQQ